MNASNVSQHLNNGNCQCRSITTAHFLNMYMQMEKYFGSPLLVFGIVCNILAILTLRQPKLKESPFIHLMGLTVSDLSALLLILINHHAVKGSRSWTIFICYIFYPLTNIAASFCVWIMVVMTLERCIFMQFPLLAPVWCTNSSAKFKVVLVCLASFAVNFPRFFWYKVVLANSNNSSSVFDNITNFQTINALYELGNNLNGSSFANVLAWMYSLILSFIPVTILLVLNSFLVYKIRAQQKRRNKMRIHNRFEPARSTEQTRLTITLIAITGLYILMVMPAAFADKNTGSVIFHKMPIELKLYQHISNLLIWLNLSFNFLMYTVINVKFMRAFKKMLKRWRTRLRNCVFVSRLVHPRVNKIDSSKTQNGTGRTKEFPLRRYPGPESRRPSWSSRLLSP